MSLRHLPSSAIRSHALTTRRALTLLELLIALSITAIVAGATSAMITAFIRATEADKSWREALIRAQAVNARLASYISPARCTLDVATDGCALWLDDPNSSTTVNATEIRWITLDSATGTLIAEMVKFPAEWDQAKRDAYDTAYPKTSDWWTVRKQFVELDLVTATPLCDEVSALAIEAGPDTEHADTLLTFTLTLSDFAGAQVVIISASVHEFMEPTS